MRLPRRLSVFRNLPKFRMPELKRRKVAEERDSAGVPGRSRLLKLRGSLASIEPVPHPTAGTDMSYPEVCKKVDKK